jgi:glycosyltransferase involved in cell wall biosynthesis
MDVSVLLATRRRPGLLRDTLDSLAAARVEEIRWELLVVDNAADRDTQRVAQDAASRLPLRLIVEPARGKNRALNRALDEARGALVAFTDDDVVVHVNWLSELWRGALRWPDATMFGGRILPRWPAGVSAPDPHPFFLHAYAVADFKHPEGRYSSGYVYGPNMAIRRAVFEAGWRFDPTLGPDGTNDYVTGSETGLTVALEQAGHTAVYLPQALVEHQIRPEQLTPAWLYGRAFRKGRAEARKRGLVGGWRRIPRDLYVQLGREYAAFCRCRLMRDQAGALDHGIAYWMSRGMIHHCRVSPPTASRA